MSAPAAAPPVPQQSATQQAPGALAPGPLTAPPVFSPAPAPPASVTPADPLAEERAQWAAERAAYEAQLATYRAGHGQGEQQLLNQFSMFQRQQEQRDQQLRAAVEQVKAEAAAEREQRRIAELVAYMNQRINDFTSAGYKMIVEMVGGNTAQEIEDSIQRAIAAYQRYYGTVPQVQAAPQALPQQPEPPVALSFQPAEMGFPTRPNAAPVTEAGSGGQNGFAEISQLTTPEAVRSGDYAKNRERLMHQLRSQGSPGMSVTVGNQPRYAAQPGITANVTNWGAVQQPQGTPMSAPINPRMYQQPQQQVPQQPQYQQPAQPVHPAGQEQGATPQQMREHAAAVAERHLRNPNSAHAMGANGPISDAGLPAAVPIQADFSAQTQGYWGATHPKAASPYGAQAAHPMARNTAPSQAA